MEVGSSGLMLQEHDSNRGTGIFCLSAQKSLACVFYPGAFSSHNFKMAVLPPSVKEKRKDKRLRGMQIELSLPSFKQHSQKLHLMTFVYPSKCSFLPKHPATSHTIAILLVWKERAGNR